MTVEPDDVFDCMARMKGEEQPFAVATVVRVEGGAAAKPGAKAVFQADGAAVGWVGGGCTLGAVRKAAAEALADGRARLIRVSPAGDLIEEAGVEGFKSMCPTGGTVEVFIYPMLPRPALLVAGASLVARALFDLAKRLGYAVSVAALADDLASFEGCDRKIEGFKLGADEGPAPGFIVIATQGKRDREALREAVATKAPYIAFVRQPQEGADPERRAYRRRRRGGRRGARALPRRHRHRGGDAGRDRALGACRHRPRAAPGEPGRGPENGGRSPGYCRRGAVAVIVEWPSRASAP